MTRPDHNIGSYVPTLCEKCAISLTSPASQYGGKAGDVAYGLLSLSEETRMSNHLPMSKGSTLPSVILRP